MSSIRAYRASDRDQVYDICIRTARAGDDATGVYSRDDLMPDLYAAPYCVLEPELAFVLDDGGTAVGYIIATADTRKFVERWRDEWLPAFAERHPLTSDLTSAEKNHILRGVHPEQMLIPEVDDYPAHLHIDLLPQARGRGHGRALLQTLRSALAASGVLGLYLSMDPANRSARAFYDRLGFHPLPSSRVDAPVLGIATSD
jgi:ribosomal protein S18 acetylase RimI-like enzyme